MVVVRLPSSTIVASAKLVWLNTSSSQLSHSAETTVNSSISDDAVESNRRDEEESG
jgi:hypothetical protein